jgi:murein DD-endopeptidase MepM/ murein hydrolase activator NlpD
VSSQATGASRAEVRRLAGDSAVERPAVVWGRPAAPKTTDAATTVAAAPEAPVADATPAAAHPIDPTKAAETVAPAQSRRARRAPQQIEYREITPALDAATPASAEALEPAPAAEGLSIAPAAETVVVVAAAVVSEVLAAAEAPAATDAPSVDAAMPAARRSRVRPQPQVFADDVAEVLEPAVATAAPAVDTAAPAAETVPPAAEQPVAETVLTPVEPFELLEPVEDEPVVAEFVTEPIDAEPVWDEPAAESWHEASGADEFEAAARLFAFTGETPVQAEDEVVEDAEVEPETIASDARHKGRKRTPRAAKPTAAPRPAKSNNGASFKRVTTASFSLGVMGVVGLLTVGMTMPTEAVAAANGSDTTSSIVAPGDTGTNIAAGEVQAYVAPASAEASPLDRTENYSTASTAQIAQTAGIKNFSNFFRNNPNSPIQWPFAVGVPISYGFGWRSGEFHEGVDFTPGAGAPVQAIADGVVRVATYSGGGYGVMVIIDHHIDGQLISSRYAHMEYGSLRVYAGEHIKVGTIIGRTGNTGHSFGAHTHFEILMNGITPIDPLPWLRAHAGG